MANKFFIKSTKITNHLHHKVVFLELFLVFLATFIGVLAAFKILSLLVVVVFGSNFSLEVKNFNLKVADLAITNNIFQSKLTASKIIVDWQDGDDIYSAALDDVDVKLSSFPFEYSKNHIKVGKLEVILPELVANANDANKINESQQKPSLDNFINSLKKYAGQKKSLEDQYSSFKESLQNLFIGELSLPVVNIQSANKTNKLSFGLQVKSMKNSSYFTNLWRVELDLCQSESCEENQFIKLRLRTNFFGFLISFAPAANVSEFNLLPALKLFGFNKEGGFFKELRFSVQAKTDSLNDYSFRELKLPLQFDFKIADKFFKSIRYKSRNKLYRFRTIVDITSEDFRNQASFSLRELYLLDFKLPDLSVSVDKYYLKFVLEELNLKKLQPIFLEVKNNLKKNTLADNIDAFSNLEGKIKNLNFSFDLIEFVFDAISFNIPRLALKNAPKKFNDIKILNLNLNYKGDSFILKKGTSFNFSTKNFLWSKSQKFSISALTDLNITTKNLHFLNGVDKNVSLDFEDFIFNLNGVKIKLTKSSVLKTQVDEMSYKLPLNFSLVANSIKPLKDFIPEKLISKNLAYWLQNSLGASKEISSDISFNLIFNLDLKNNLKISEVKGLNFNASFKAKKSKLKFLPEWPSLTVNNLSLKYEQKNANLLKIDGRTGRLDDIALRNLRTIIYLQKDSYLDISAETATNLKGLRSLFLKSPIADGLHLRDFFKNVLEVKSNKGEIMGNLNLLIPLSPKSKKRTKKLKIQGKYSMRNADFKIYKINFTNINVPEFNLDTLSLNAPKITGLIEGATLQGFVKTNSKNELKLYLSSAPKLERFVKKISGVAATKFSLQAPLGAKKPKNKPLLKIALEVALANLTMPVDSVLNNFKFNKSNFNLDISYFDDEERILNMSVLSKAELKNKLNFVFYKQTLRDKKSNLFVLLDNKSSYKTVMDQKSNFIKRANTLKENAYKLMIDISKLDFKDLSDLFSNPVKFALPSSKFEAKELLDDIKNAALLKSVIKIDELTFNNYFLDEVKLAIYKNVKQDLIGDLSAKNLTAKISLNKNNDVRRLSFMTDNFKISQKTIKIQSKKTTKEVGIKNQICKKGFHLNKYLDVIDVKGKNIYLGAYKLNEVTLLMNLKEQYLNNLEVLLPNFKLQMTGPVVYSSSKNNTEYDSIFRNGLNFLLYIDNIKKFVDYFGITDEVTGQDFSLEGNLWFDKKDCWNLENVFSKFKGQVRKGKLNKVSIGHLNILGLLNPASYLSKLGSGFYNLGSKEVFYDNINFTGSFAKLELNIENFRLVNSIATLTLNGGINFLDEKIDLKAKVSPKIGAIGSGLLLGLNVVNPMTFLYTFFAGKFVESRVEFFKYSLTGDFEDPVILLEK